jgi:hypothetical protein
VTAAPELAAARLALAGLPEPWVSGGLAASVERRAIVQAAHRLLTEQADRARAAAEVAVATVTGGDLTVLDELVAASTELMAVERAQAALPAADLDSTAVQAALATAQAALDVADRTLGMPVPQYDAELGWWRQAARAGGQVIDPPVPSDADRAVSARVAELSDQVEQAWGGTRAWRTDARSNTDPLAMLAAAVGHLAAVEALAVEVAELRVADEVANEARAAAGLTWEHPLVAAGFRWSP